ncbi:hypothetical protein [Pseudomonas sp. NPDC089569]|uniref:hypothetical protein n=1 Tax=Pseudomonas sp. NPDC089569 TaxID=3390722 RepID=UPI003D023FFE
MELNQTLTITISQRVGQPLQYYPEYDKHLHRMQRLAFEVGKVMMKQPQGSVAKLSNGEFIGITEYRGKLEVVLLYDYTDCRPIDDVYWFCFTRQTYQDPDWGSEEQLDEMSEILTAWMANPVYVTLADPERLPKLAKHLEAWIADYEANNKPSVGTH